MLIYALIDPRDGAVRYIGKTMRTANRRLRRHLARCYVEDVHTHKNRWLRELLALGLEPSIVVVETCASPGALNESEKRHIASALASGARLTNSTPGGDGGSGKHTPESKEKIRRALAGKPKTAQHRLNSGMAQRGKVVTKETRMKLSEERRRRGWYPPPRYGEANNKTKLTADAIKEICRLRGIVSQRDLAARFGVSHSAIGKVQRKHLRVREWPRC